MALDVELNPKISDEALKSINAFSKNAQKSLSDIESSVNFGAIALGVGLLLKTASKGIDLIVDNFKDLTKAASDQEDSIIKLNVALASTGDLTSGASESIQKLASDLQKSTGISDDLVISQAALAKSYGLTNDQVEKVIKAAVDLSAVTGESLNSSVEKLSKTYNGFQDKTLTRLIPSLQGLTEKQLKNGAAIDAVSGKFKDFAVQIAGTYSGSIAIASAGFGEFQESLGRVITQNPVVLALIKKTGEVFNTLSDFIDKNKQSIITFIAEGIKSLISVGPFLITTLKIISEILRFVTNTILDATQAVIILIRLLLDFKIVTDVLNTLADGFKAIGAAIVKTLSYIFELADSIPGLRTLAKNLGFDFKELSKVTNTFAEDVVLSIGKDISQDFREGIDKSIDAVAYLKESSDKGFDSISSGLDLAKDNALKFSDSLNKISNTAKDTAKEVKNLEKTIKLLSPDAVRKQIQEGLKSPLTAKITAKISEIKFPEGSEFPMLIAQATGIASSLLKGAAGAVDLISGAGGAIADAFLPGLGGPVKEILGVLAKGPEEVKKLVDQFVAALPEVIKNIVKAIPVLIKALIEAIPELIDALIEAIPELIDALIDALPDLIDAIIEKLPIIAEKLAIAMAIKIPEALTKALFRLFERAGERLIEAFSQIFDFISKIPETILKALEDGIKGIFDRQGGSISIGGDGNIGGFENAVGVDLPGSFAKGGLVPGGFPNDTFKANLTSGELVIPKNDVNLLRDFLQGQFGQTSERPIQSDRRDNESVLTVVLNVGEDQLAKVLLNLNRKGFRTV